MSLTPREVAAAVARSRAGHQRPARTMPSARHALAGFLPALKARHAEVGVWEVRGRVFARVMAAGRNARLSGAEWSVLATVALHLQHLGKSKGWMSLESIAGDCEVSTKTVRRALRSLQAGRFLTMTGEDAPRPTLRLHARFKPRSSEPVNNPVDKPKARKKRGQNCPAKNRAASPIPPRSGKLYSAVPAQRQTAVQIPTRQKRRAESPADSSKVETAHGPAPPRKRASPVASG